MSAESAPALVAQMVASIPAPSPQKDGSAVTAGGETDAAVSAPLANNVAAQTADQVVIRRSAYSLTGQVIAVRVSGDPAGNNGLHYVFSDHLGSASVVTDAGGNVQGGVQRFYPFGGARSDGGFDAITDQTSAGCHLPGIVRIGTLG